MKIVRKIVLCFFGIAALVGVSTLTGLSMLDRVANSDQAVINDYLPFKDVSMEAAPAAQQSMIACESYLLHRDNLESIEEEIHEYIEDFEMFVAMVEFGTESPEFKNSSSGQMYIKDGLDLVVPRGDVQMQELLQEIKGPAEEFAQGAETILTSHRALSQYNFSVQETETSVRPCVITIP